MKSILFLSAVMERGWGVSVEIGEICRRLRRDGVSAFVGASRTDSSFDWLGVESVSHEPEAIQALATRCGAQVIAAQTSPYFEALPDLSARFETWAWENGDPTPSFFVDSRRERSAIARQKLESVYPRVGRVIAISDFIKHDVGWPGADVIRLGCDHVPPLPPKGPDEVGGSESRPVRVGTLMRLGRGEAHYKGNHLFLQLLDALRAEHVPAELHVAGRGTEEDAASFRARGIVPHLNLDDAAKVAYLRSLDVFVSMSLWEGFNLPLAEAQAVGTLALALDTGAHPEICPYLVGHVTDVVRYVARAAEDRRWLLDASARCARFIRTNYSWESTAAAVRTLLDTSAVPR
jgi:glycosyltransferase involved in cell wall biosynthesis